MDKLEVKNTTRSKTPGVPFEKIRKNLLPLWIISLVFVTPRKAQILNKKLRKKTYVPNVLSYEVGHKSGEVIICLHQARKEASLYGFSSSTYCAYLFIHALLHLKGYPHGSTMDRLERATLARLSLIPSHEKTNRDRHRHRNPSGKDRHRRRGTRT